MYRQIIVTTLRALGLILLVAIASGRAAGAGLPHETEAFRYIARQLETERVVALADFAHGNAYPYHTLLQVLSHWLDLATPTGGRLVLVLEMDPEPTKVLRAYLQTGDMAPVLEYWLPFSSLDQLAFYRDLREFTLRIQRANEGSDEEHRIGFDVLGFETFNMWTLADREAKDLPDLSQAATVANERDRRVADALLAYIKEHPQDRVLAFYGDAHLCIRETQKSWATKLFGATKSWQPMAFLLKQELGTGFLSIAQSPLPRAALNPNGPYRDMLGRDTFVKSSDVPWKLTRIDPADYDAMVFLSSQGIDEAHQVRYICSGRILDQAITKLARIEKLPENAFIATYSLPSRVVDGLRFITGQSFETAEQWRQWAEANPYNGFARIDSDEFAEAIRRECCQPMNKDRSAKLGSLGLPPVLCGRQQQITPEQWRNVWPKVSPRVRFLQCVGLYWIGDPDEKAKAREFLVQFSGQEFDSAAMYLKWYRNSCLGLKY